MSNKKNSINNIGEEKVEEMPKGKIDRKGSHKFKKVATLVLVGTGLIIGALKLPSLISDNLIVPEVSYSLEQSIYKNANTTCFDEVLLNNQELVRDTLNLEEYLNMSKKFNDLNLISYGDVTSTPIENDDIINSYETYYQEYIELLSRVNFKVLSADSLRLFELVSILKGYEEEVNSRITIADCDTLANYGILLIKSILLDASGLGYENINNIQIPAKSKEYIMIYKDQVSNQTFTIDITQYSFAKTLLESIYNLQSNDKNIKTDSDIRKELTDIINYYKVAQYLTYENNGTLKNVTNFGDVREMIDTEEKTR